MENNQTIQVGQLVRSIHTKRVYRVVDVKDGRVFGKWTSSDGKITRLYARNVKRVIIKNIKL